MEERVNELLPLAAKIAREFGNIPGLPFAEIELTAQEALANAARLFDPEKGDFTPYAARAMRNALRDLYERQKRHHHHHEYVLNENPVPIRERMPGLEKSLAAVIDQALVRNPKARFADAGKLLAALPKQKT